MTAGIPPATNERLAAALSVLEGRQAIIANNLANTSTVGFKGARSFTSLMADGATPTLESATDFRPGALATTGNPLDVAILGDGSFLVRTPQGERLTRAGQFGMNGDGELVDRNGFTVLGAGPTASERHPIRIPPGTAEIVITASGSVHADGVAVGELAIHRAPEGAITRQEAGGLAATTPASVAVDSSQRAVRQGTIEESNVSAVDTLVQMINVQRLYASAQRALSAVDSARGIAISEIGKPL